MWELRSTERKEGVSDSRTQIVLTSHLLEYGHSVSSQVQLLEELQPPEIRYAREAIEREIDQAKGGKVVAQ